MKNLLIIGILLYLTASCNNNSQNNNIKIKVLDNYEFILNEEKYPMNNFEKVFKLANTKMLENGSLKYDILLYVSNGVAIKTINKIKKVFFKFKKNIDEIKYSHE